MEQNYVGRPTDPNGITKVGKQVMLWLDLKDLEKLVQITKALRISKSLTIRQLIKEYKNS